ncbi:matrixin family metalloprotease [Aquimarina hainanensis]|uniref:Matrixin family metalloprotease n=1 Tax=Aquimarina hainanensis TaxID=1578017 RepID=A0ABW5NB52_9FLAO|nr:matrixin family metalloprotease [Aquimarina sp. TRL1]QKX06718.1 matrixin family metalloprotease [Aquimarina sp. TRL1]
MKTLSLIFIGILLLSCSKGEENVSTTELIQMENIENKLIVDIIYVLPSGGFYTNAMYKLDEVQFLNYLNEGYFHKYNIELIQGESRDFINDELFNLRDNRYKETEVFLDQTASFHKKGKLSIFIIKRDNILAIAGIGGEDRVLITDKFLYTNTTAHEIGHALGLSHVSEIDNIMSTKKNERRFFKDIQLELLKGRINQLSSF